MVHNFGIIPEIISGILNFWDWDFRDSGLLKLPGLRFLGFRIPELQDLPGFTIFRDPEPLPSLNVESEIQMFNVIFHRSQGGTAQKDENFSDPWHQFFALGSSNCCDEGWKNF